MINASIYTLCYNEDKIIQFFIDHYRSIFPNCQIVIFDNYSTDNSLDIAKRNDCIIRPYPSKDELDDDVNRNIKNNCWKEDKSDWIIVCDTDELIQINQEQLQYEQSIGTTIFKPIGYNMLNKDNKKNYSEIIYGDRCENYDKCILFNKKEIEEINYSHGAHVCSPIGNVKYNTNEYKLLHYKYLNEEYFVNRAMETASRLSDKNKKYGWGIQVMQSEQQLREHYRGMMNNGKVIL